MAHISENTQSLKVKYTLVKNSNYLCKETQGFTNVCVIVLPPCIKPSDYRIPLQEVDKILIDVATIIDEQATLIVIGEAIDLVQVQANISALVQYQHWVIIKRKSPKLINNCFLPNHHFGALIYTKYKQPLHYAKTRIKYTYCPICNKTTKDYGGKKHTYHESVTLISDVWRDLVCELEGDLEPVINRFADLFGIEPYKEIQVFDCRLMNLNRIQSSTINVTSQENKIPEDLIDQVLEGDCLERLREIPDNSIDFVFSDPPYNLGKKYLGYSDNLEVKEYFKWCDRWIAETVRVLKPGRTCAILNVPLWAVRHFLFIKTVLEFQNWIVWDALAFPVRLIMPAHYTILCFSKGEPRQLPGLTGTAGTLHITSAAKTFDALKPLADSYCLRSVCLNKRKERNINARTTLTDLWTDIHRLKHNSRRVDHPCQLPPHLMYRIISIFTKPDEVVLDCFNGAGTTTLAANQLRRKYIGIEALDKYCLIARERHAEIIAGLDPFRKEERTLTAKNSPVPRLLKQKYEISKKTLQLEVKRIANQLGHLPSRDEVIKYGEYSIEYYDKYFVSWGEVCAAARTTGMTENKTPDNRLPERVQQNLLPEPES